MANKKIKFDFQMKGINVTNFEELRDNFSADILPIFQSNNLAKWLILRKLLAQAEAIAVIDKNGTELQQLGDICSVLELDNDEEVLQFLLDDRKAAQAAAVPTPASDAYEVDFEVTDIFTSSGINWSGQDMSGRQFIGEDLRKANLEKTNFSGSDLSRADFNGANLKGAIFNDACLNYANFENADLTGAILRNSRSIVDGDYSMETCSTESVNFSYAILTNSILDACIFYSPNFSGATLIHASLIGSRLFNANFKNADLSFSNLRSAIFMRDSKKIKNANLGKYNGFQVNSHIVDITDAKLTGVIGFNVKNKFLLLSDSIKPHLI